MGIDAAVAVLGRLLLASGLATLLVLLLRRPLRAWLGARAAYALWWCVPAAMAAVALPARRVAMQELPSGVVQWQALHAAQAQAVLPDVQGWLAAAWLLGAASMAGLLLHRQRRFLRGLGRLRPGADGVVYAAAGAGLPVALGLWRPRIVLPHDFADRFAPDEQPLVIAHERVHLRRGDLWAHALAALVLCLHWFNPVVHYALRRFRLDQELACDALVIARAPGARKAYGNALLKTQAAMGTHAPLGCHWPPRHPLKERIVMLKRRTPGRYSAIASLVLVMGVALSTGYAAWAQQPARIEAASAAGAAPAATARDARPASDAMLPAPRYPVEALKQGLGGKVVLLVDVDAHGVPVHMQVESSEPAGVFERSVLETAAKWRFVPATQGGRPIAGRVRVPVTFETQMEPVAAPQAYAGAGYAWYRLGWDGPASRRVCDVLLADAAQAGTLCGIGKVAGR